MAVPQEMMKGPLKNQNVKNSLHTGHVVVKKLKDINRPQSYIKRRMGLSRIMLDDGPPNRQQESLKLSFTVTVNVENHPETSVRSEISWTIHGTKGFVRSQGCATWY